MQTSILHQSIGEAGWYRELIDARDRDIARLDRLGG
jgi:hypothetical protein